MSPPKVDISSNILGRGVCIFGGKAAFCFTIDTRNTSAGSTSSNQFKPPTVSGGTYDFNIDWGDTSNDDISTWDDAALTHTYATEGIYTVSISGTFTGWSFNYSGDREKILDIANWGNGVLTFIGSGGLYGCTNLTVSAEEGEPSFTGGSYPQQFVAYCPALTTIPGMENWDWSSATTAYQIARSATLFNQALPDMPLVTRIDAGFRDSAFNQAMPDLSAVTNIGTALLNADSYDQDLSSLPWAIITAAANFMLNATGISTANYDATLIAMDAASVSSLTIHFGGAKYTGGGAAETARTNLVGRGCTITDGGVAP